MPKLCRAGQQLREQIDDAFPARSRTSPEGWLGDQRHAARKSDHNPTAEGIVRAIDINANLQTNPAEAFDLADQLRLLARTDKRISYIIFNSKIASWKKNYKWRKYTGINPHNTHIHVSFTAKGDYDGSMFRIPLLTGEPLDQVSSRNPFNHKKRNSVTASGKSPNCPTCQRSSLSGR